MKTNSNSILMASVGALFLTASLRAEERHAYFDETHMHTAFSLDAYIGEMYSTMYRAWSSPIWYTP